MLGLSFEHPEVIDIGGNFYVKTPQALQELLAFLQEAGYNIKNIRKDKHALEHSTVQQMEQNGHYLWFASLDNLDRGKCGSCNSYILTRGI